MRQQWCHDATHLHLQARAVATKVSPQLQLRLTRQPSQGELPQPPPSLRFLEEPHWDVVNCDESHTSSAHHTCSHTARVSHAKGLQELDIVDLPRLVGVDGIQQFPHLALAEPQAALLEANEELFR